MSWGTLLAKLYGWYDRKKSGWWFQIFFMFTPSWGNDPFWLIFFKGVDATNQKLFFWGGLLVRPWKAGWAVGSIIGKSQPFYFWRCNMQSITCWTCPQVMFQFHVCVFIASSICDRYLAWSLVTFFFAPSTGYREANMVVFLEAHFEDGFFIATVIENISNTPWKFNKAPEKWWLEDYFPIGKVTFQGAMLNFVRVYFFVHDLGKWWPCYTTSPLKWCFFSRGMYIPPNMRSAY